MLLWPVTLTCNTAKVPERRELYAVGTERTTHAPRMSPSTKWLAALCALLDCVGGAAVMPW